jgi:hypothetical protein
MRESGFSGSGGRRFSVGADVPALAGSGPSRTRRVPGRFCGCVSSHGRGPPSRETASRHARPPIGRSTRGDHGDNVQLQRDAQRHRCFECRGNSRSRGVPPVRASGRVGDQVELLLLRGPAIAWPHQDRRSERVTRATGGPVAGLPIKRWVSLQSRLRHRPTEPVPSLGGCQRRARASFASGPRAGGAPGRWGWPLVQGSPVWVLSGTSVRETRSVRPAVVSRCLPRGPLAARCPRAARAVSTAATCRRTRRNGG